MKFKKQIIAAVTCAVVLLGIFLTVSYVGGNNNTANNDKDKQQVTTDKTKEDEKDESKQTDDKKTEDKQTNDQQSQKDEVKMGTYEVKKGDTIYSIARAYMPNHDHLEVIAMIKQKNLLKDDTIVEKQKLTIPYEVALESKSTSTSVDKTKEENKDTAQATKTGIKYVIKSGDSLWKIASEQMPKVAQLEAVEKIKAHNNITNENTIKTGDTIYIPEQ